MMETVFSKVYEKIDLTLRNHLLRLILDQITSLQRKTWC